MGGGGDNSDKYAAKGKGGQEGMMRDTLGFLKKAE